MSMKQVVAKVMARAVAPELSLFLTAAMAITVSLWLVPVGWEQASVLFLRGAARSPWLFLGCVAAGCLRLIITLLFERTALGFVPHFALFLNGIFFGFTLLVVTIGVLAPGLAALIQTNKDVYIGVLAIGLPLLLLLLLWGVAIITQKNE